MEHLYFQNLIGKYIDYYGLDMKKIVQTPAAYIIIFKIVKRYYIFILEFFFIYKPRYITMKFDAEKTLNYFEHLHDNEKHLYNELLSFKSCEMKNINKIQLGDRIRLINRKII